MKIGILYVGIGKYIRLWDKFYSSCESLFLPQYEKNTSYSPLSVKKQH
mgnify:CR=1 FL=1